MTHPEEPTDNRQSERQHAEVVGLLVHAYNNHIAAIVGNAELAQLEVESERLAERLQEVVTAADAAVLTGKEILSAYARLQIPAQKVSLDEICAQLRLKEISTVEVLEDESWCKLNIDWFIHALSKWIALNEHFGFAAAQMRVEFARQADHLLLTLSGAEEIFVQFDDEQLRRPFFSSREVIGSKDVGTAVLYGYCQQLGGQCKLAGDQLALQIRLPLQKN